MVTHLTVSNEISFFNVFHACTFCFAKICWLTFRIPYPFKNDFTRFMIRIKIRVSLGLGALGS